MKQVNAYIFRSACAAVAMFMAGGAAAQQLGDQPMQFAQGAADCYSVGQRVAAENGGTLAKATAEARGGQTVCHIVVVVPGGNGERPRRAEFTVPAQ